jgi:hypothetical protein
MGHCSITVRQSPQRPAGIAGLSRVVLESIDIEDGGANVVFLTPPAVRGAEERENEH